MAGGGDGASSNRCYFHVRVVCAEHNNPGTRRRWFERRADNEPNELVGATKLGASGRLFDGVAVRIARPDNTVFMIVSGFLRTK